MHIAATTALLHDSAAVPRLADPRDWGGQLGILGDLGFRYVDLSDFWIPLGSLDREDLARLRSALVSAGLTPIGVSCVGVELADPAAHSRSMDWAATTMSNAALLGVPHVSLGLHPHAAGPSLPGLRPGWVDLQAPPQFSDDQYRAVAAGLGQLADEAARLSLTLSLEMHDRTMLNNSASSIRLLDAVARPNVGINLDLGNLVRPPWPLEETWFETLERLVTRMNYWHVKNGLRIELPGGRAASVFSSLDGGTIDYRTAILCAQDAGYEGPLVVEHSGGDPLHFASRALTYLRALVRES